MKKKIIHVNMFKIRRNIGKKAKELEAPIIVRTGGKTYNGFTVKIHGDSKIVYSPQKPLSCGARVWIETHAMVEFGTRRFK